jgi:hypothetical protein
MPNQCGIRVLMRCDTNSGGWVGPLRFIQGIARQAHITRTCPEPHDAAAPINVPAVTEA